MPVRRTDFGGAGDIVLAADAFGSAGDPCIILLPAGGQTRFAWWRSAELFVQRGYYVLWFDLRGHGESGWAAGGFASPEDAAAMVRAYLPERPPRSALALRNNLRTGDDGRLYWHWDPPSMPDRSSAPRRECCIGWRRRRAAFAYRWCLSVESAARSSMSRRSNTLCNCCHTRRRYGSQAPVTWSPAIATMSSARQFWIFLAICLAEARRPQAKACDRSLNYQESRFATYP
jgi:hypothetical protein